MESLANPIEQSFEEIAANRADQERTHGFTNAAARSQTRFTSQRFTSGLQYIGIFPAILYLFCGDEGDRTLNLRLAKPALSQLSYVPESINRGLTASARHSYWVHMDSNHGPQPYQGCALAN